MVAGKKADVNCERGEKRSNRLQLNTKANVISAVQISPSPSMEILEKFILGKIQKVVRLDPTPHPINSQNFKNALLRK